jgi:hypothetical protein
MNRIIALIASVVAFAFLALSFLSRDALAQNTSLVGTWTLVSVDSIAADGSRTHGYGPNPAGIAIFDAAGRYAIQVQSTNRPKFTSNDRLKGTPEENQAYVQGVNPHWGRYSVNDTDHTITFPIEHAAYPNWDGTQQIRPFTLIGDVLKYITPATANNGRTVEVVWQRAK